MKRLLVVLGLSLALLCGCSGEQAEKPAEDVGQSTETVTETVTETPKQETETPTEKPTEEKPPKKPLRRRSAPTPGWRPPVPRPRPARPAA